MPPDEFAMEGLKALNVQWIRRLERKRRLGQYAVFWGNGRVVFDGPDAPKKEPSLDPKTHADPGNASGRR